MWWVPHAHGCSLVLGGEDEDIGGRWWVVGDGWWGCGWRAGGGGPWGWVTLAPVRGMWPGAGGWWAGDDWAPGAWLDGCSHVRAAQARECTRRVPAEAPALMRLADDGGTAMTHPVKGPAGRCGDELVVLLQDLLEAWRSREGGCRARQCGGEGEGVRFAAELAYCGGAPASGLVWCPRPGGLGHPLVWVRLGSRKDAAGTPAAAGVAG